MFTDRRTDRRQTDIMITIPLVLPRGKNYINMLKSLNCPNQVKVSTRFGNLSNTILDHIITNVEESKIEYGFLDLAITDHLPIFAVLKHKIASPENKSEQTGQMWQKLDDSKKENFLCLLEENLSCIDLGNEPNEMLQNLTVATKKTRDTCFPPQQLSKKAKKRAEQPWVDRSRKGSKLNCSEKAIRLEMRRT